MHGNIKMPMMLAAGLLTAAAHPAAAATESIIYSFPTVAQGQGPGPLLITSTGNLEGTTFVGGGDHGHGRGTFFRLHPPAAGATAWKHVLLYSFSTSVGYQPVGNVVHRNNSYYGVDELGGVGLNGILYKMSPLGIQTTLHSFTYQNSDGCDPEGVNVDSHGNFYGIT